MRTSKELQIGKAGEYMVCADLILKGFIAFPSEQGLPYDVLLDIGHKLLRVQVKTTTGPRIVPQRNKETKAYIFNIKRNGKLGLRKYSDGEVDVFALVCLDTHKIGYLLSHEMPDTINIRVDGLRGTYYDEKGVVDFLNVQKLSTTFSPKEIAKQTGIHISQISRYLQEGYKPYETKARYFSDFERTHKWFIKL